MIESKKPSLQNFEIRTISISKIKRAKYNPRREFTEIEKKSFTKNLDKFSCVHLLVWNETTGNLIGGHKRLDWLEAKGAKEVKVAVVKLDEIEEKQLNLALNKYGEGLWDWEKLEALRDELDSVQWEMAGFGLEEDLDLSKFALPSDNDSEGEDLEGDQANLKGKVIFYFNNPDDTAKLKKYNTGKIREWDGDKLLEDLQGAGLLDGE